MAGAIRSSRAIGTGGAFGAGEADTQAQQAAAEAAIPAPVATRLT